MNSNQIDQILRKNKFTKKYFLGVYSSDKLPTRLLKYPYCFVANTDPHWLKGQHWISIWVSSPRSVEYFCSLGQKPNKPFQDYLDKFKKIQTNDKQIQGANENTCGYFCIYFLMSRATGQSFSEIMSILWRTRAMADILVKFFVRYLLFP